MNKFSQTTFKNNTLHMMTPPSFLSNYSEFMATDNLKYTYNTHILHRKI